MGRSIFCGDSTSIQNELKTDVKQVFSSSFAFAALRDGGSVITWGEEYGGDSSSVESELQSGVISVSSTTGAFAALKEDGTVVTWGGEEYGGNSEAVQEELGDISNKVEKIYRIQLLLPLSRWMGLLSCG